MHNSTKKFCLDQLEHRDVPANNLTIVSGASFTNVVSATDQGVLTILTTDASAELGIERIEEWMRDPALTQVVIKSTVSVDGIDTHQAGNIVWDSRLIGRDLDFADFGFGKTLTLATEATASQGDIAILAANFANGSGQASLQIDTTASGGNIQLGALFISTTAGLSGNQPVRFNSQQVEKLTLHSGGSLRWDVGSGDFATGLPNSVLNDLSMTGIDLELHPSNGLSVGGNLVLQGAGTLHSNSITVVGDLTMDRPTLVSADDITIVSEIGDDLLVQVGGAIRGSGLVNLHSDQILQVASSAIDLSGSLAVAANESIVDIAGPISVTQGIQVAGQASIALTVAGNLQAANGAIHFTGTGTATVAVAGAITTNHDFRLEMPQTVLLTASIQAQRDITFTGLVQIANDLVLQAGTAAEIQINDLEATNSMAAATLDLSLQSGTIRMLGEVGSQTQLQSLTVANGHLLVVNVTVHVAQLSLGDGLFTGQRDSQLSGTGTIIGDVELAADVIVAPGGINTVGQLTIQGNLALNGSVLTLDLGSVSDRLRVLDNPNTPPSEGNVTLTNQSVLGGGFGIGVLPAGANTVAIETTGTITGTFANAPINMPLIVGQDAVQVVQTGGLSGQGLVLSRVPALAKGSFKGADPDGTIITATLTGGGELIVFRETSPVTGDNAQSPLDLVIRGSTKLSKLIVRTVIAGVNDRASFGRIFIHGSLGTLDAPKADVAHSLRVGGLVKVATIYQLGSNARMEVGGTPFVDQLRLTVQELFGTVETPSSFAQLTVAKELTGTVTAAEFERVNVGKMTGILQGLEGTPSSIGLLIAKSFSGRIGNVDLLRCGQLSGSIGAVTTLSADRIQDLTITANTRIEALTAGSIRNLNLTAGSIKSFRVLRNVPLKWSGDLIDSTITLNGGFAFDDYVLKSLTVGGNVQNTNFDLQGGNVQAVSVGSFVGSQFRLGYTPQGSFEAGGTFDAQSFTISSFTTTMLNLASFADSILAAKTIRTIRLSNLDTTNNNRTFGIKVGTANTSLRVKKVDTTTILLNRNLVPNLTALGNDFYFLQL